MTEAVCCDLGTTPYQACFELQRRLAALVASGERPPTLLLVQHPPVLTLGASFHEENLLLPTELYRELGIEVCRTDRGGDVTYHGPGQLVAYPIFPLELAGRDLHRWLRELEETLIRTVAAFGLAGRRFPPHTGVWVGDRKIAAIGVKVRRWVSYHGIALNCDNDLSPFQWIVPCGIRDYGVTSLSEECGRRVECGEAARAFAEAVQVVFGLRLRQVGTEDLTLPPVG
ncbi:MAG: lipoyl(octanoyl) transferase LipB [Fimbriimonadales bacterium]|nr:lipoyl(octanoyl) transferase LipB [Fimbriimonadales bacterium]